MNKKETDLNNSMEITKGELLKNGVMNKTEVVSANNEEKKEEINLEKKLMILFSLPFNDLQDIFERYI